MPHSHPLAAFVRKLEGHSDLSAADRDAVLALPVTMHSLPANRPIVHEGSAVKSCCFLKSGYAFRSKLTTSGTRQILAIHVRGDALDLQNAVLPRADHSVYALTALEAAFVPVDAVRGLTASNPGVALALWRDAMIDASIQREWIVNVGRRDAEARIAHLLCELALREQAAGLTTDDQFELPMTQEVIADCTGLTPVHVNRMMQRLRSRMLVEQRGRNLKVENWSNLTEIADFQPDYLFVEPVAPFQGGGSGNGSTKAFPRLASVV